MNHVFRDPLYRLAYRSAVPDVMLNNGQCDFRRLASPGEMKCRIIIGDSLIAQAAGQAHGSRFAFNGTSGAQFRIRLTDHRSSSAGYSVIIRLQ